MTVKGKASQNDNGVVKIQVYEKLLRFNIALFGLVWFLNGWLALRPSI